MLGIRKDDTVYVIAGKDKGKTGKVLTVMPKQNRAIVEGINFIKKSMRRRSEQESGGIIDRESPIHVSNLMLFCRSCKKPSRIKTIILKDKTRSRACARCKEVL